MATRYQHVPIEVLSGIAKQVEGLLWEHRRPTKKMMTTEQPVS
jgi:hypothetical protein